MQGRLLATVVVALTVMTAGCAGVDLPGTSAGGDSPGDDSPDGPADGDSPGGDGNPVDGTGSPAGDAALVDDPSAALASAGSYTTTWSMRMTEDGAVVGETTYVTAVDVEAERFTFVATSTSDGEVRTALESYHADGRTYQRYGGDDEATYAVGESEFTAQPGMATGATVYGGDLSEFEVAGTETFDGVTVTRYTMTQRPTWVTSGETTDGDVEWEEFTYEVLVDADGLVRYEHWRWVGTEDDGTEAVMEFTYEVRGLGTTTVEEPAWVDTAREESGG